jgi:tetratricopeptide (TPR) repeat protein
MQIEQFNDALTACDRALALDDKQAETWAYKGVALNFLKRHRKALAACDRALALDPKCYMALYGKRHVLKDLGPLRALGRYREMEETERQLEALERRAKELGYKLTLW